MVTQSINTPEEERTLTQAFGHNKKKGALEKRRVQCH